MYDVWLMAFAGDEWRAVAGLVEVFGIDRDTAKQIVGSLPRAVRRGADEKTAKAMKAALENIGAKVALPPAGRAPAAALSSARLISTGPPQRQGVSRPMVSTPPEVIAPAPLAPTAPEMPAVPRAPKVPSGVGQVAQVGPSAEEVKVAKEAIYEIENAEIDFGGAAAPSDAALRESGYMAAVDARELAALDERDLAGLGDLDIDEGALAGPAPKPGGAFGTSAAEVSLPPLAGPPGAALPEPATEVAMPAVFADLPTLDDPPPPARPAPVRRPSASGVGSAGDAFGDDFGLSDGGLELEDIAPVGVPSRHPDVATSNAPPAQPAFGQPRQSTAGAQPPAQAQQPAQAADWTPPEAAAPDHDWRVYKGELAAYATAIAIIGFGIMIDNSVFQGKAGLLGVFIDSQAITLIIMASLSAWQRYKMFTDDSDGEIEP